MNGKYKCCICGYEFSGYGNNPWPLANDDSKCCDMCNMKYVLVARLVNLKDGKQTINTKNAPDFIYACATTISRN